MEASPFPSCGYQSRDMSEVVKATAWMTGENCHADVCDALRETLESLAPGAAENCIEVVAPHVYFFYFPCPIKNRVQPMGECPRWGFVVQLTLQSWRGTGIEFQSGQFARCGRTSSRGTNS